MKPTTIKWSVWHCRNLLWPVMSVVINGKIAWLSIWAMIINTRQMYTRTTLTLVGVWHLAGWPPRNTICASVWRLYGALQMNILHHYHHIITCYSSTPKHLKAHHTTVLGAQCSVKRLLIGNNSHPWVLFFSKNMSWTCLTRNFASIVPLQGL